MFSFRQLVWASQGRSGHWATVRKHHLEAFPNCAVCGGQKKLEVHHKKPFHLHPELELDENNLITLCEKSEVLGCNCHLVFGHGGSWLRFIPRVSENAALLLPQILEAKK